MQTRKIVFDLDDTLWPLNDIICKIENIDIAKITRFNLMESDLTEDEVQRMIRGYANFRIYKTLPFFEAIKRFPEIRAAGGEIFINSHSFDPGVVSVKYERCTELDIPKDHIEINLIDKNHPEQKKEIGEDVFVFIDDSVFNQMHALAQNKIMITQPWNMYVPKKFTYIRSDSLDNAIDHVIDLLKHS